MTIVNYKFRLTAFWAIAVCLLASCKQSAEVFENPYSGGKAALAIKYSNSNTISPLEGAANDTVMVDIPGAAEYRDKLHFQFSGSEAEVLNISGNTVTVVVPAAGSSGATSITIGDQVFFGPQFKVLGKVIDDPYFKAQIGANNGIYDAYKLKNGSYLMVGNFTDFNNKGAVTPVKRIIETTFEGDVQRRLQLGVGLSSGFLTSATSSVNDANIFIAGSMSSFDQKGPIRNITKLTAAGAIDVVQVETFISKNVPGKPKQTVPAFNGGTDGVITKIFYFNDRVIAFGNFKNYLSFRYDQGRSFPNPNGVGTVYRDSTITDSVRVNQVASFKLDGKLDNSYHFSNGATLPGGNGSIADAWMQPDGKIILVGAFSKFDNKAVGGIVRLNTDGTVDDTFKSGTGALGYITSITWSEESQRFVITGVFGSFNQLPYQNILLLKSDGSVDDSFVPGNFDNGFPYYAKQLSNGLIVVSGSFRKYNGVKRSGFMILNPLGKLAPGYNTLGEFSGTIYKVIEEKNKDNKRSILLVGQFQKFDSQPVNNIKGLVLED